MIILKVFFFPLKKGTLIFFFFPTVIADGYLTSTQMKEQINNFSQGTSSYPVILYAGRSQSFQIHQQSKCILHFLSHTKYFTLHWGGKKGEKKGQEKGHLFIIQVPYPLDFLETWRAYSNESHWAILIHLPIILSEAQPPLGQAAHRNLAASASDGRDVIGLHLYAVRTAFLCRAVESLLCR